VPAELAAPFEGFALELAELGPLAELEPARPSSSRIGDGKPLERRFQR
jgi:hypothetical protein